MGSCHLNWRLLVRVTAYVYRKLDNNKLTQKHFIQIKIKCAVSKKENVKFKFIYKQPTTLHNQNATEVLNLS